MKTTTNIIGAFVYGMVGVPAALLIVLTMVYGQRTIDALHVVGSLSSMLLTGEPDFRSLGGGFSANILISVVAMAISMVAGLILGVGLIARNTLLRGASRFLMNFLRNSPWLVVIYAMLYLIPYEFAVLGTTIVLSPAVKAIIGLALPVSANIAEVLRGGIQTVPRGQWEAARSLGYSQRQILIEVVGPQALPLMIPNIMSVYAALFIGTSLVVVTGENDIISTGRILVASGFDVYATAIYIFILFAFFAYTFPIAMFTRWLEMHVRNAR